MNHGNLKNQILILLSRQEMTEDQLISGVLGSAYETRRCLEELVSLGRINKWHQKQSRLILWGLIDWPVKTVWYGKK